jgi:hypothetical protein
MKLHRSYAPYKNCEASCSFSLSDQHNFEKFFYIIPSNSQKRFIREPNIPYNVLVHRLTSSYRICGTNFKTDNSD